MLWDLFQQMQISDASSSASEAKSRAMKVGDEVARLRTSVETLSLTCAALWELLSEKTGLSEQDLASRIYDIDMRDGKLDGKLRMSPKECASCNRPNNPTRARCLYCGKPLGGTAFG